VHCDGHGREGNRLHLHAPREVAGSAVGSPSPQALARDDPGKQRLGHGCHLKGLVDASRIEPRAPDKANQQSGHDGGDDERNQNLDKREAR
jgi:hypothetical protein